MALICALAALPAGGWSACRQALSIGLDISGSVDVAEYRLQTDGLAGALRNPQVQQAFLAMPGAPVRLHIFEWAGIGTQRDLAPWTEITDTAALDNIADTLQATVRRPRQVQTAIGVAMLYGAGALNRQGECWRRTLDLTGDGKSNQGPRPRDVRNVPDMTDITVNALVISGAGQSHELFADLTAYFSAEVLRGPEAFVETALGFAAFQEAMERKLLKELQTFAIGHLKSQTQ
ncbi:MAG: DUF1194 domain-containing protein [Marinosulfonomonas sp.]|nr:DUF1194 domain-containing protein [Marinosulfonomonas sp.]